MPKVLIVGGGAREHALGRGLLAGGPHELLFAPGNAGTRSLGRNVSVAATDVDDIVQCARDEHVDLVVVGPEAPLVSGLGDALRRRGIAVFGPSQAAARLEGSKAFMKQLCHAARIPTARYAVFSDAERALRFAQTSPSPLVVKADGLCAGKGVFVASSVDETCDAIERVMRRGEVGDAGRTVVLEERLVGQEVSFHVVCDGTRVFPLVAARDHKPLLDGDRGPNTGGMGAYAPHSIVTREVHAHVMDDIIHPALRALSAMGSPFCGVLYAGLMVHEGRARVLEFNVRLGDPEATVLVPLYKSCWFSLLDGAARGNLPLSGIHEPSAAVSVVMAAEGYPRSPAVGDVISGLEAVNCLQDTFVYHAGTSQRGGEVVTSGGRVLAVTSVGAHLGEARARAYSALGQVSFRGARYRTDIGAHGTRP